MNGHHLGDDRENERERVCLCVRETKERERETGGPGCVCVGSESRFPLAGVRESKGLDRV